MKQSFLCFLLRILFDQTGALTFAAVKRFKPQAGIRRGVIDITLDNNYAAGGWAIAGSNLGIKGKGVILVLITPGTKNGRPLEWDQVNGKLKAYKEADAAGALAEIAAADLNGQVVRCEYIGY